MQSMENGLGEEVYQGVWKGFWQSLMVWFGIVVGIGMVYFEGCDLFFVQVFVDDVDSVSILDMVVVIGL